MEINCPAGTRPSPAQGLGSAVLLCGASLLAFVLAIPSPVNAQAYDSPLPADQALPARVLESEIEPLIVGLSSPRFLERQAAAAALRQAADAGQAGAVLKSLASHWLGNPSAFHEELPTWDYAWYAHGWGFEQFLTPGAAALVGPAVGLNKPAVEPVATLSSAEIELVINSLLPVLKSAPAGPRLLAYGALQLPPGMKLPNTPEFTEPARVANAPDAEGNMRTQLIPPEKEAESRGLLPGEVAERLYQLALCQEETLSEVQRQLAVKVAESKDREKEIWQTQLRELGPILCAEIWAKEEGNVWKHQTAQFLVVGYPQFPEGGRTATYFSQANDSKAHLEMGNLLRAGDYDVHAAFLFDPFGQHDPNVQRALRMQQGALRLHAMQEHRIFYLALLPSAPVRLAYEVYLNRVAQGVRRQAIIERTVAAWKRDGREIGESELGVLAAFAPRQLETELLKQLGLLLPAERAGIAKLPAEDNDSPSRAAEAELVAAPGWDLELEVDAETAPGQAAPSDRKSRLLRRLSNLGDLQTADRLLAGLNAQGEVQAEPAPETTPKPVDQLPANQAQAVAERLTASEKAQAYCVWLAMVARHAGPEADARLMTVLSSQEPLATEEGQSTQATLGASAAATLVSRHGFPPGLFELDVLPLDRMEVQTVRTFDRFPAYMANTGLFGQPFTARWLTRSERGMPLVERWWRQRTAYLKERTGIP